MEKLRVAFITTVRHNVGDDFVREGIIYLLGEKFGSGVTTENIHKHAPVTVRHGFEKVRKLRSSRMLDGLLPVTLGRDRILESDMLIQSGAPVFWCHAEAHCSDIEWYSPLISKRYSRVQDRVPFLNLAAGSCQRYWSDETEPSLLPCDRDLEFIARLYDTAKVTTVRDRLAKRILNAIGRDAPVIPCSSIFARDRLGIQPAEPEYVALNYMHRGGHYDFGRAIDAERWQHTFSALYRELSRTERCVFICHNAAEVREARRFDARAEILISERYEDYIRFYSRAKYGILNRVHGAFALASFGRPSFVIGTDSRARMPMEIGLRDGFVPSVDLNRLLDEAAYLQAGAEDYSSRFAAIRERAYSDYMNALEGV